MSKAKELVEKYNVEEGLDKQDMAKLDRDLFNLDSLVMTFVNRADDPKVKADMEKILKLLEKADKIFQKIKLPK